MHIPPKRDDHMNPRLWGPGVWHILFSCCWNAWTREREEEDTSLLLYLIDVLLPILLPCEACRTNYERHSPKVTRKSPVTSPSTAFRWLYLMKDQVNRIVRQPSIRFEELVGRCRLHGGEMDDVQAADTLVLLAIDATERGEEDAFASFCKTISRLSPLPHDSSLAISLATVTSRCIVAQSVRAAKAARVERGLPEQTRKHYEAIAKSV